MIKTTEKQQKKQTRKIYKLHWQNYISGNSHHAEEFLNFKI